MIGDVVVVKDDDAIRNYWRLGRIIDVKYSKDGLVRSASIRMSDSTLDKFGKRIGKATDIQRPIHKLVLVLESDSGASPPKNQP